MAHMAEPGFIPRDDVTPMTANDLATEDHISTVLGRLLEQQTPPPAAGGMLAQQQHPAVVPDAQYNHVTVPSRGGGRRHHGGGGRSKRRTTKVRGDDDVLAGDKVIADRFRTKLCNKWVESGVCPYEGRCMFAHGEEELRTTAMNLRDGCTTEESIKQFKRALHLQQKAQQRAAALVPAPRSDQQPPLGQHNQSHQQPPVMFQPFSGFQVSGGVGANPQQSHHQQQQQQYYTQQPQHQLFYPPTEPSGDVNPNPAAAVSAPMQQGGFSSSAAQQPVARPGSGTRTQPPQQWYSGTPQPPAHQQQGGQQHYAGGAAPGYHPQQQPQQQQPQTGPLVAGPALITGLVPSTHHDQAPSSSASSVASTGPAAAAGRFGEAAPYPKW